MWNKWRGEVKKIRCRVRTAALSGVQTRWTGESWTIPLFFSYKHLRSISNSLAIPLKLTLCPITRVSFYPDSFWVNYRSRWSLPAWNCPHRGFDSHRFLLQCTALAVTDFLTTPNHLGSRTSGLHTFFKNEILTKYHSFVVVIGEHIWRNRPGVLTAANIIKLLLSQFKICQSIS